MKETAKIMRRRKRQGELAKMRKVVILPVLAANRISATLLFTPTSKPNTMAR